jgi:hypothetical protein
MSTVLDDILRERISFLLEQVRPEHKPKVNQTFKLQAEILKSADLEKLDASILIRRNHLKHSTNVKETDRLFAELEALEWLQRQLQKSKQV